MSLELDYGPVMTMPLSKDMTGDGILAGLVSYWQCEDKGLFKVFNSMNHFVSDLGKIERQGRL